MEYFLKPVENEWGVYENKQELRFLPFEGFVKLVFLDFEQSFPPYRHLVGIFASIYSQVSNR
jgi:hypothetical protein